MINNKNLRYRLDKNMQEKNKYNVVALAKLADICPRVKEEEFTKFKGYKIKNSLKKIQKPKSCP